MQKSIYFVLFLFVGIALQAQELKSPEEFLGYKLGERFTRHHKVIEYYEHVAETMSNVRVEQYGETYEHRPLYLAFLSSQKNFDNLEQIRQDNLKRAGMMAGSPSGEKIAIVWLSYNVHGNESSSSEATMETLYELVNPSNSKTQGWLENTVVIMDPCINPDGRDRYANFYNQYGNAIPNPNLDSKEHMEPWPGGRTNHYYFDLNRDWAWLTQAESQARIKYYNDWLPHVHVDFHEQGLNNPYYFPPAAQPYHEIITPWQSEFQNLIGQNHAKYFNENGWLFFTKEVFDLFYPSYGDTYPTFNGAIGMTYEKGGSGRAGLQGLMNNGDTVMLSDRILHHHTTGLSTVEVSSIQSERLVDEFTTYYDKAKNNPSSRYKTFVIKGSNHPDKLTKVTSWLEKHLIEYGKGSTKKASSGFNYRTGSNSSVSIADDDILISAFQPKSNLVQALFEPTSKLVDSLTYDITAWAIPYVYDLEAYALTERVSVTPTKYTQPKVSVAPAGKPYAYINAYKSFDDQRWLAQLFRKGVQVRVANESFQIEGINYDKGAMVVLRWDNEHLENFDQIVTEITNSLNRNIKSVSGGLVNQGKDFGSYYYNLLTPPSIAVLSGEQVSSYDFGEIWHFFERDLEYPITVIDTDYFNRVDLSKYDVLVVPGGYYRLFNESTRSDLQEWIRSGGRLVAMGRALRSFVNKDGFALKTYRTESEEKDADKRDEELNERLLLMRYDDELRESLSDNIPGAIFRVKIDNTHPLAYGYTDQYFTLKLSGSRYAYLEDGWNVGVLNSGNDVISGYVGSRVKQDLNQTLVMGVEEMGRGSAVWFVDNMLFRSFWYSGKMMFGNSVFVR